SIFSLCIFYASPPPYISTLSLHDALPILEKYRIGSEIAEILGEIDIMPAVLAQTLVRLRAEDVERQQRAAAREEQRRREEEAARDRKSTRLNSSHVSISYAVFCLKKKKKK